MRILCSNEVDAERAAVAEDESVLVLSRGELAFLANSVQEALEVVDEWEFDTRLGMRPEESRMLHDRIRSFLMENRSGE
ncbi:hypothetical protein [Kribbella shirazensis]|uniref:Uncharacterized protein n=1 Tax=Kribbella shirazensis TaxID=1105143 RepID=A0A7X5VCI7_9ACTN|nr:hypothetical protein [Kribbella shirazensis]NIK58276.1 hypothetical protein [Kribbella shirazensis]